MAEKKQEVNYSLIQIEWFTTRKVTIKGEKVEIPIEWQKTLLGIYPSYDDALYILRKAQGNYRKEMNILGKKPIAKFSIRKTGKPVTTQKVKPHRQHEEYLLQQTEV
tara:strand:- start:920 stop:1240 length:321 start_codon:yes stop_codon:yes gene_type:complete